MDSFVRTAVDRRGFERLRTVLRTVVAWNLPKFGTILNYTRWTILTRCNLAKSATGDLEQFKTILNLRMGKERSEIVRNLLSCVYCSVFAVTLLIELNSIWRGFSAVSFQINSAVLPLFRCSMNNVHWTLYLLYALHSVVAVEAWCPSLQLHWEPCLLAATTFFWPNLAADNCKIYPSSESRELNHNRSSGRRSGRWKDVFLLSL